MREWAQRYWPLTLWWLCITLFTTWFMLNKMAWWQALLTGALVATVMLKYAEYQRRIDDQRETWRLRQRLKNSVGKGLVEELSEAAHNAWLAEKKKRGVTTWPNERGFEQMVPYDQCSEDVKEFDRVVIRAVALRLLEETNQMDLDLTIFGEADEQTLKQARNCLAIQDGARGVLCADNHLGYAQPVGMAIGYRDRISVSGVGYDIGCGNKAVKTDICAEEIDVARVMDEIYARIEFGIGLSEGEQYDHPVLDHIREAEFAPQRTLLDKAANQLGTVGGGNHYVDLFEDEDGALWIGVHFGSRGFGHTTANGFLWMARGMDWQTKGECKEDQFADPVTFSTDSYEGEAYIAAMKLAGEYAYAGRDVVVDRVLSILGARAQYEVHNHHNYAWEEEHFGEKLMVVRKGCTPAFPGQAGFVGSTMLEDSVILEGAEGIGRKVGEFGFEKSDTQQEALFSTVHGAGRVMSRTRAAGKVKQRWTCCNRDCDWFQPPSTHKPQDGCCPECGHPKLTKQWQQMSEAEIDWQAEVGRVRERRIELRGSGAEEAPGAYKRLEDVLAAQGDTITVLHRLRPIGVAMAPVGIPADD